MTEHPVARLDDPAHMRALAHPSRLRILGLLRANGPQTAALLGEATGEAPGTISYHCRRLADVGLIAEAPGENADRRERWWRAVHAVSSWDSAQHLDDPERFGAATALDRAATRTLQAMYESYLDAAPRLDPGWIAASSSSDALLRLTPEELTGLGAELAAVVDRFRALSDAHVDDDGAERVVTVTQAYRWPAPLASPAS